MSTTTASSLQLDCISHLAHHLIHLVYSTSQDQEMMHQTMMSFNIMGVGCIVQECRGGAGWCSPQQSGAGAEVVLPGWCSQQSAVSSLVQVHTMHR